MSEPTRKFVQPAYGESLPWEVAFDNSRLYMAARTRLAAAEQDNATLRARLAEVERERDNALDEVDDLRKHLTNATLDVTNAEAEADRLRAVVEGGAQLMAEAAWFLRHAAKQGVTEHRGMSDMAERLAEHVVAARDALDGGDDEKR